MKHSGVIETGLSDHCLVYAVLNRKLMHPKADKITRRSFKNFDQKALLCDLNTVPFSVAYIFDDPDDVYWCWEQLPYLLVYKSTSCISRPPFFKIKNRISYHFGENK